MNLIKSSFMKENYCYFEEFVTIKNLGNGWIFNDGFWNETYIL